MTGALASPAGSLCSPGPGRFDQSSTGFLRFSAHVAMYLFGIVAFLVLKLTRYGNSTGDPSGQYGRARATLVVEERLPERRVGGALGGGRDAIEHGQQRRSPVLKPVRGELLGTFLIERQSSGVPVSVMRGMPQPIDILCLEVRLKVSISTTCRGAPDRSGR